MSPDSKIVVPRQPPPQAPLAAPANDAHPPHVMAIGGANGHGQHTPTTTTINGVMHFSPPTAYNGHMTNGHAAKSRQQQGGPTFGSSRRSRSFYKWLSLGTALFCAGLLLVTVALALTFWKRLQSFEGHDHHTGSEGWPKPSGSLHGKFKRAAIATDNGLCSDIGRNVLIEGGNAIDAAIAALACTGVVNPQASGPGGGLLMTVYNATTRRCLTLNARETAPLLANQTMFVGRGHDAVHGYRAIGIPGEIHGMWTAFTRYGSGRVSWRRLIEPAAHLARTGFPITAALGIVLRFHSKRIHADPSMRSVFVNPKTDDVYEEGDILRRPSLANFFDEIANATDPVQVFYKGRMATVMVNEMTANGGLISLDDLAQFTSIIDEEPLLAEGVLPGGLVMCGPKPPAGNAVVNAIVGILSQFYNSENNNATSSDANDAPTTPLTDDPLFYHRLIEAQKFAYAQRTKLGDVVFVPEAFQVAKNLSSREWIQKIAALIGKEAQFIEHYLFANEKTAQPEDHGTSHVSAIDQQGNAISVTSSVNQWLGAMRASPTLGFIWNDEMDDFSTPGQLNLFGFAPSPTNFIVPKKRPQSSMSPVLIYNATSGKIRMSVGASGGARIISSIAQTVIRSLLLGETVKEAVDAPRFHNQFVPFTTEYELTAPHWLIDNLVNEHAQNMTGIERQASVVQVLEVDEKDFEIYGNSDFRRATATYPAGF